ncbi:MAG: hypothetical protein IT380_11315 [Myxococcales bacterium]|nr:hypothetical protein [Myxococcales bacterium]
MKRLGFALVLWASASLAMETQVLPKGTWMVDLAYMRSTIDKQWDGERRAVSLIPEMPRYEPGGGLQGILRARPDATFHFLLLQVMYGLTDKLSLAVYLPIVLDTTIQTNLSWEPGDYQSQLGRAYSEDDFWAWAASMGQPRVPNVWSGNHGRISDIILGARYLLPQFEWMKSSGFRWAGTLQVALPTGSNLDPEEAVSAGTNLWELHAAGTIEAHLSADQPFLEDDGVSRGNVGADLFYAACLPRRYTSGTGATNPLLTNAAPYVGETYWIDGGDWLGGTLSVDVVPIIGPTRATIVSGNSLEKAKTLPPLLTLSLAYTHIRTLQSYWNGDSALWAWDREKLWQPGEKNLVKGTVTLSFLRVGLPLQVYVSYRTQDLIPGRYTRPANVLTAGIRTVLKFW